MLLQTQNNHGKTKKKVMLRAVEYRHFTTLRLINLFILGVLATVVVVLSLFMYQRIYTTIGQIQELVTIGPELGAEVIDFTNLEKADITWQKKYLVIELSISRDPFNPLPTPVETTDSLEDGETTKSSLN